MNNMEWINELLWGQGIGHSILLLSVAIAIGIQLGKIKLFGVSLGVTFVLFVGLLLGQLGFQIHPQVVHFFKEFGLILFVYSIGMQVGPSFFSTFKRGGIRLNLLAVSIIILGAGVTVALHYLTNIPMPTLVGVMSGAITNTPGLGAAQQAYSDATGATDPTIALGYAVAYPLGVVGIILSMILIRYFFRVKFDQENARLESEAQTNEKGVVPASLIVKNPAVFNKRIADISTILGAHEVIISRIWRNDNNQIEIATGETLLCENDKIFVVAKADDLEAVKIIIGQEIQMERKQWVLANAEFVSRRILVTKPELNGKRLADLQLRRLHGVNITRINRAGVDLVAAPGLELQVGDRLTVVGSELSISNVEKVLGNSMKRLNEPNLVAIFIGIALGILLGSIPLTLPGVPQPIKLGLAGGPLIVAILISRFGYHYKLITYSTQSANLMLREIGIAIFLACVGISAGEGFIDTIINDGGLAWIGYGFLITILPLLIVGCVARQFFKINYFTLMGLMAGSTTDPPALAYSNTVVGNDAPAVGYAMVYPLSMFLRVVVAQLLILLYLS